MMLDRDRRRIQFDVVERGTGRKGLATGESSTIRGRMWILWEDAEAPEHVSVSAFDIERGTQRIVEIEP